MKPLHIGVAVWCLYNAVTDHKAGRATWVGLDLGCAALNIAMLFL